MKNNLQRDLNNFVDLNSLGSLTPLHVICVTFRTRFVTKVTMKMNSLSERVPCSQVDHRHFARTDGKKSHSACRLLSAGYLLTPQL
jgi:hypothetical protein